MVVMTMMIMVPSMIPEQAFPRFQDLILNLPEFCLQIETDGLSNNPLLIACPLKETIIMGLTIPTATTLSNKD